MTTLVSALIEDTWAKLYTSRRRTIDVLATTITGADTSVVLTDGTEVSAGDELEIDDELIRVWTYTDATRTATVIRGWGGSTAAAHTAGAVVDINPLFPRRRVRQALQEEIRSFPSELYKTLSVDLTTSATEAGIDLAGVPSTYLSILDVQLGPRSSVDDLAVVRPAWYEVRDADTDIYPSGAGIVLTGAVGSIRDLRVTVAIPFDVSTFTDATDVEATVGLAASMVDIPPMGAAARLMVGREVKRTLGEGQQEPRRAEEVPVGSSSGTATFLRREVTRRIGEEIVRLRAVNPIRRS